MTLYGDWDGLMGRDYQMKDNESNVVLIDRQGTIRYASYGRITDRQFVEIEELLDRLVHQED
jgi:predicted transcriptional regulator